MRLVEHFSGQRPLAIRILTMSDRASAGEYEDLSGPRVVGHLEEFLGERAITFDLSRKILSDDAAGLEAELRAIMSDGVDLVFTTGGTGAGPRDNTPDVVMALADKIIPGIMEVIRVRYAADNPCALLSRTVVAILGSTIVYTLPGSRKGVDEYMGEILKSMEHLLCVIHEIEAH